MEKKILQDVVPPGKRSIRAISKDRPVRQVSEPIIEQHEDMHEDAYQQTPPPYIRKKKTFSKTALSLSVLISVIVVAFALSLVYASATVKINPKSEDVSVDKIFTAKKDARPGELQYEVMTLTKQRGEVVPATEGGHVEVKARGTIVLYNEYSTTPQTLVVNTRVENTKGQIYKTEKQITIPGMKKVNGENVPGSAEVTIVASEPGANYNAEIADLTGDFRITAFKGDPKYQTFYGRLKTDITGGFVGVSKIVDPDVAASVKAKMRQDLKDQLLKDAETQIPEDFVFYDSAYSLEYESLPNTQKTNQEVVMNEKAVLHTIIFKEDNLNKHIAPEEMAKFTKGKVEGVGLEDVEFAITNPDQFDPENGAPLLFSLKGDYKLVGDFPEEELKAKLKGKSVKDISTILSQYGTISTADVIIRPFWKRSFPENQSRITIEKTI